MAIHLVRSLITCSGGGALSLAHRLTVVRAGASELPTKRNYPPDQRPEWGPLTFKARGL
jgi:hypothetical protein